MTTRCQPWYRLSAVTTALIWLLPPKLNATHRTAYRLARHFILTRAPSPEIWKVDGNAVTRLAKAALRRLPNDPKQLGDTLQGLGEIAARSHISIIDPLIAHLGRRRLLRFDRVFAAAFVREPKTLGPLRFDTVAFVQWLSSATTINWNTLALALSHVERGHVHLGSGYYGLKFTARIILALDARAVDTCIQTHPNNERLASIGNAAIEMAFPFDGKAQPSALLRSRNAAIRSIGAAALISPLEVMGTPLSFRDCRATLVAGGIEPSDATWIMGLRIKEAIHQRYRLEDALKNVAARLHYVEMNPQAATGGPQNADGELRMLRSQLDSHTERHSRLLPQLEGMLADMATDWPEDGLVDEQMQWLDNIFVDTAEFRHRLAEKLPHGQNRDWLLKRNIARAQDYIGLAAKATDVQADYFSPDERHFLPLADWAAQSLSLLYATDRHGIGKRTSFLVSGVAQAATTLMAQPFLEARKPEAFQAILTRAACAIRFALIVVANVPQDSRNVVLTLNGLALEHTFEILPYGQVPAQASETFFRLTCLAINNMRYQPSPDQVREAWGLAETLPDFARALALWSSPDLVTKHRALASDLFCRVGELPLSQGGQDLQMSQMLSLLDIAISSCAAAGRTDLNSKIISLWSTAYKDWHTTNNTWADSATMLVGAVAGDGPERTRLRADSFFVRAYCAQLIGLHDRKMDT